ncbi:LysM peptidoglycan-binding domain-containing protein [Rhizobium wuzhouense]|uniref:Peptidoglycan-binding protein n=1 Tax=Rhizobium wuzhouense TaxID=1986026 RepID=A0ABX5NLY5_9HYPH|nr:LysM peptidoglycan-binding domain-containing protein [Rhizobium wuzhouense]PYB70898.1 peptidoglycan-binding protein [Rhizobium wuzhouense]
MKNRALWVVLLVLAIVSLLMVFVIMPRLNPSSETAPAISAATDAVKSAADQAAATAETATANIADAAAQKMDRLKAEAVKAVDGINALFADGRTPGVEAYSAAKTLAQGAVSALAAIDVPEGLDAKLAETIKALQADAAKALSMIQQLPDDPAKAAGLVASIKDALLGKPVETAAAPAADAAASDLPRFDVLRVEPDGSTVIAGNAAPGAKVEIINGNDVISSQTVDGTGDFAAVLDNPLPPGDHSLQIRATGVDGKTVTSEEVATISVPEGGKGELLAMVSTPGKASRLITLPGAADAAAPAPSAAPAASTSVPPASDVAAAPAAETAAPSASGLPDLPAASSQLAGSAPTIPAGGSDVAAAPAAPSASETPAATTSPAVISAEIQVTAVEIEGDRIFVAGKAPIGSTVRGFADKATIGESKTDASGHFVIDGTMALSVGSHIIEVELLDASGKVVVRASVPFERPEGEQVSVVAPAPDAAAAQTTPEQAEFERLRISLTKALTILEGLYANGQKPALEQLAAARSATEFGLQSIIGFRAGSTASADFTASVAAHGAKAKEALALLQSVNTGDVDGLGAILPKLAALIRDLLDQPTPPADASAAETSTPAAPAATAAAPSTGADTAAAPKTIQQAPLAKSDNSVIIRRGDTLWQISRRVYGQGVRYTTIYLANENQIRNPDRIAPGQIFTVPKDALPNAEEIHRKRLRGEPVN